MHDSLGLVEQSAIWVAAYLPSVYAGICAFLISLLSDIRIGQKILHMVTGAMICGISALATSSLLEYIGLPGNSGAFVGALLGFAGADRLREIAITLVFRKTGFTKNRPEGEKNE